MSLASGNPLGAIVPTREARFRLEESPDPGAQAMGYPRNNDPRFKPMPFSCLHPPTQRWPRWWLGGTLVAVLSAGLGAIATPGTAQAQLPSPLQQNRSPADQDFPGDQAFIDNCRQAAASTNIFTGEQQIMRYCTCSLRELNSRYTRAEIIAMYADLQRQQAGGATPDLPRGMIEIATTCLSEAGVTVPNSPSP